jgi:hypothetical protein
MALLGADRAGGERVQAVGHDWLEVTALPALELEPEPVEELVAPTLPELVELPELVVVVVGVVVAVVVPTAVLTVAVRLASAGSWPVMSTTAMSDHTARKSATEPPTTRERIIRTRARRCARILFPSSLVMTRRIVAIRDTGVCWG